MRARTSSHGWASSGAPVLGTIALATVLTAACATGDHADLYEERYPPTVTGSTGGSTATSGPTTTTTTSSTPSGTGGTGSGGTGGAKPSTNDCCVDNATPGCNTASVEQCVCGVDAYCCQSAWDSLCVEVAKNQCNACGGPTSPPSTSSSSSGGPSVSCEQCILQQCGLQCMLDCSCPASMHLLVFQCLVFTCAQPCWGWQPPGGGGGGTGGTGGGVPFDACCQESASPGCDDDPSIEQCVCAQDSYCCNTAWDATCVSEVDSFGCGTCGS